VLNAGTAVILCSIEGSGTFSKTVVGKELAERVLESEIAAFSGGKPCRDHTKCVDGKSFIIVKAEQVTP
jgi:hypothetical protein